MRDDYIRNSLRMINVYECAKLHVIIHFHGIHLHTSINSIIYIYFTFYCKICFRPDYLYFPYLGHLFCVHKDRQS